MYFNSHAHVERDDILSDCLNDGEDFNSHAHVERDTHFTALALYYTNFNSHAHVERDQKVRCEMPDAVISTHTLTWSVTDIQLVKLRNISFQLTRSRGA